MRDQRGFDGFGMAWEDIDGAPRWIPRCNSNSRPHRCQRIIGIIAAATIGVGCAWCCGADVDALRAKALGIEALLDECDDLILLTPAGESFGVGAAKVAKTRLLVDTRKWFASKLLPKKYGEHTRLEHTGPGGGPIGVLAVRAPEALVADAIRMGLVDWLPAELQEMAKKRLSAGNSAQTVDNPTDQTRPLI